MCLSRVGERRAEVAFWRQSIIGAPNVRTAGTSPRVAFEARLTFTRLVSDSYAAITNSVADVGAIRVLIYLERVQPES